MKKKPILNEEGLKALFGKTEIKAEESVEVEIEANADVTESVEPEIEAVDPVVDEGNPELEALAQEFEDFKVASAEAEAHADAALMAAEESIADMKGIVIDQISRMRIALGLSAVDMSDFKADAVVTEYTSISEKFMKALPVGSVVPEPAEHKETTKMTSLDMSAINSLGF